MPSMFTLLSYPMESYSLLIKKRGKYQHGYLKELGVKLMLIRKLSLSDLGKLPNLSDPWFLLL